MKAIDFHVHAFPDDLAPRAMEILSAQSGVKPYFDGTISGLLSSMERAGIEASVVQPVATKPSQVRSINNWLIGLKNERIIPFGAMHPEFENPYEELRRIKELGIKGIKLHCDYQGRFVDDEAYMPIYEAMERLGMILMLHAGVDIGLPPPYHATPERILRILEAFPKLRVVAAHMGSFKMWDEVEEKLIGREIYLDTSYVRGFMEDERALRMMREHGFDRILFASDSPWADQKAELEWILRLGIPEGELEKVLSGNAERLLSG
ncbi:amidohydrolase [Candidatus Poribacteria bacterium]|nr:MAG: amidohydrolase [Candidatus Poribacteria bacterium]